MSDYQVILQAPAEKQLRLLPIGIGSRILTKIRELANEPRPAGCVKLKGKENRWRIRVGDYRVIYSIDDGSFSIYILTVAHRREVYER